VKKKWLPLFTLVVLIITAPCRATVVTFDELSDSTTGTFIPTGYQGLVWSNFAYVNAILMSNTFGYANGANYGMVSPSNVAFNAGGTPAEIDSPGTNFDFLSAFLTGAWESNLNIEVQGFNGNDLLYNQIVVVSATNATLFTFNYTDIDRLYFNSYGGDPAFGPNDGNNFVMDNLTFEFVPEPSAFLLTAAGALMLWSVVKRKRG